MWREGWTWGGCGNEYYKKILKKILDEELKDYVTCEEYYPLVLEDYGENFEYALEDSVKNMGSFW